MCASLLNADVPILNRKLVILKRRCIQARFFLDRDEKKLPNNLHTVFHNGHRVTKLTSSSILEITYSVFNTHVEYKVRLRRI